MNLLSLRLSLVYAGILASSVLSCRTFAGTPSNNAGKVFVGYLYRRPEKINFDLYTHLCHAFIVADEEGHLLPRESVPSRELTEDAHRADVKVILSLGGWGWDKQFAAMVTKPDAEDRYVKAVMGIVDEYDYDGIDLDWEYPDTETEVVGFERLARRFRKQLDIIGTRKGRPMLQTMAVSAGPVTLKWLTNEILLETMNWVNVMTYDFAGPWTPYAGHHSPLYASSKQPAQNRRSTELTMRYMVEERGFPADRLAVGIPLYGRGFAASKPYAPKKDAPHIRVPRGSYSNLYKLQHEERWTRQWDAETKNPWLVSPDRTVVIGYDDEESVSIKTEWVMKQGFRGVFFWQIGADLLPDGTNPLQEASHEKWRESLRPPDN